MVETIRLESGHTLTGIVGSNPTLSAIISLDSHFSALKTFLTVRSQFSNVSRDVANHIPASLELRSKCPLTFCMLLGQTKLHEGRARVASLAGRRFSPSLGAH